MADNFCPHCMSDISAKDDFCPYCGRETNLQEKFNQLPIGTVLRNEKGRTYLFGKTIGEGGFGITYIAKEMRSGKVVAIKEYFPIRCQPQRQPDSSVCPTEAQRILFQNGMQSFLSEASMLYAVRNIGSIVHVLDFFESNGTAYMVMEYLNGTTFADLLKLQSRFEPTLLLRKFLPLMRDLAQLHSAGVLHRDIAPDNIMLMPDGSLKLLDFGCARSLEDGKSMTVVLKPGFAPLEQYQSRGQGPCTDIYALCATLYYCLSGIVPPAAPERLTAVFDGQPDPLQPPSAHGIMISPALERILLWGLSLQPSARPQSMAQLLTEFEKALPASEPESETAARPAQTPFTGTPRLPDGENKVSAAPGPAESWTNDFLKQYGLKILLGLAILTIIVLLLVR